VLHVLIATHENLIYTIPYDMKDNKPRTDKRKNVGKVAEALVNDPNKTVREIARETWLWSSTVQRAKEEVAQSGTKDETIAYIVGSAKTRLRRISGIFDRYIGEVEDKKEINAFDMRTIKDIAKDDQSRITVLWWDVTDKDGWLKENSINIMSDKELLWLIENVTTK